VNVFAIDVGYSNVKVETVVDGRRRRAQFPSVVGPATQRGYSLAAADDFTITIDEGRTWHVGRTAMRESRYQAGARDPEWIRRPEYRVLFDAALSEVYRSSAEVAVVTGLPIGHYAAWWPVLKETMEGEHTFQRSGRPRQTVRVAHCAVATQGLGAILGQALDDAGTVRDNVWSRGRVAVADIGGVTINVVTTDALATSGVWSVSDDLGLLPALDAIGAEIRERLPGITPQAREVAEWVKDGQFPYQGAEYSLTEIAQPHLEVVADLVAARLGELLPEPGRLGGLLLAGGGALLLGDLLRQRLAVTFPKITVGDEWSNVEGYLKLGRYLQRQERL
jgi:plasmid segregation protein ParM